MKRRGWLVACVLSAAALAGAWAQVAPEAVQSLPFAAVGGEPASESELVLSLSPGGTMLALSDGGRVWLYRRDAGERIALTPAPVPRQPYNPAGVVDVVGMQWQPGATLLAWVLLQNGSTQAYAADAGGARGPVLRARPAPGMDRAAFVARHAIAAEPDFILNAYANRQAAVWTENRGHGSLALMEQAPGGAPRQLAQGGWELEEVVFDAQASRVIYATDKGIAVQRVPAGRAQQVAGTQAGDRAHDFDSASRWLVLTRPNEGCGAAGADDRGEHICLLRLPPAEAVAQGGTAAVPAAPAGAPGASARPSFDCGQARSVTERLLCERSPLARLDVELAGLYRQALERGPNPSALKKQQLEWMHERDAACTAGKTLAQAREGLAVDTCLRERYGQRMRQLRNQAAPDVGTTALQAVPTAALQGTGFDTQGCLASQAALPDDGKALGLEMNCTDAGGGRAFWLIDLQRRKAIAASPPALGPVDPQAITVSVRGADMLWSGAILAIYTSGKDLSAHAHADGQWLPMSFAAAADGPPKSANLGMPHSLRAQREASAAARKAAQAMDDDGLLRNTALRVGGSLLWLSDQGRGNVVLRSHREGVPGTAELHRGSWELLHLVHDERQIIYPGEGALMLLDLADGVAHRISGTAVGDIPLAWNPKTRQLAWTSPRMCGMDKGDSPIGRQLCTAVLDAVR